MIGPSYHNSVSFLLMNFFHDTSKIRAERQAVLLEISAHASLMDCTICFSYFHLYVSYSPGTAHTTCINHYVVY